MNLTLKAIPLVLLVLAEAACGSSSAPPPMSDGAVGSGGATSAGGNTGAGGQISAEVAACEASVDAVSSACNKDPSAGILCPYNAIRPLCTTGRTSFITPLFDCIRNNAPRGCLTPSDPSGATACVSALVASSATDTDRALGAVLCACETPAPTGCNQNLPPGMANAMVMSASDVSALTSCIVSMGCANTSACISMSPIGALFACQ